MHCPFYSIHKSGGTKKLLNAVKEIKKWNSGYMKVIPDIGKVKAGRTCIITIDGIIKHNPCKIDRCHCDVVSSTNFARFVQW